MIGTLVVDDKYEVIATVMGTYHPRFYFEFLVPQSFKAQTELWDKDWPEWATKPLLILYYREKSRNMSRKEVAEHFGLTLEQVSDKLYEAVTKEYQTMVVPYDSVKLVEPNENKNSN